MKITDLIVESEQLDELTAAGVGQGIGKAADAVGAVAGGVKGAWQAAKKGFEKGRATVAGETPPQQAAAPQTTAPATQNGAAAPGGEDPVALQQQADKLEAELKIVKGKIASASKAAATPAAPEAPKQSMADKVAAAQQPAAAPEAPADPTQQAAAPATDPATTPAEPAGGKGTGQNFDPQTGKPISQYGQKQAATSAEPAPQTATTPAADPAATPAANGKLTAAQQAAKVAELKGKRAAGKTAGTTGSGFSQYVDKASGERIVGADAQGNPITKKINASKINLGNTLSESLAEKIEQYKRKLFETGLANGTSSVFKK